MVIPDGRARPQPRLSIGGQWFAKVTNEKLTIAG